MNNHYNLLVARHNEILKQIELFSKVLSDRERDPTTLEIAHLYTKRGELHGLKYAMDLIVASGQLIGYKGETNDE